ncbi:MAG TPA: glycosyltransferase family 2 protein [Salinivirgaceae bacterium]|nr:glycosyltransferase family 2 protein [Salinivirgaceae bacterium]
MNPKIAIAILNWNGLTFLQRFIPILTKYSDYPNVKIWVIDNGSTDKSVEWLQKEYDSIEIVKLDKNYGFTGGYNRGLKEINAQYFVILNSDIEVTPGWLLAPIEILENNPQIAAVSPKIRALANREMFEYAGAAGGFIDKLGFPFCRGRIISSTELDFRQYDSTIPIFWASGACMFIKAELFHKVGGFDENFFAHMEEIDLCWRLKNLGYDIYNVHNSIVYHVGGGTLPNENPRKIYLNYRNNLLLLYKNLPSKDWRKIFAVRIIFDLFALIVFVAQRKAKFALSIVKAYRDFFKLKKLYIGQTYYQNAFKHKEILKKSIVVQYFIRKKRKFSEINFN